MKTFLAAAALSAIIAVSISPILLATARQDMSQSTHCENHDLQAPRKNEGIEALLDCQDTQTARENQDVQAPRENRKMAT